MIVAEVKVPLSQGDHKTLQVPIRLRLTLTSSKLRGRFSALSTPLTL